MAFRAPPPPPLATVPVLVASEDPATRRRLEGVVAAAGMTLVAAARDPDEALWLGGDLRPRLVVLALRRADEAVAVLEELREREAATDVVILTQGEATEPFLDAMRAGACGYLPIDTPDELVAQALGDVLAGRPAVAQGLLAALVGELRAS